jgi:hypothetical protein
MTVRFSMDLSALQDVLRALPERVDVAGRLGVARAAQAAIAAAKQKAQGRPGPMMLNGRLRDSIKVVGVEHPSSGLWRVRVAPTAPNARREEIGFHGTDSLGRVYAQEAFPFFRPGIRDALPRIRAITLQEWRSALGER